jgi:hypothetical protein
MYVHLTCCAWQSNTRGSTGCVRLDIKLLKPAQIEFAEQPAPSLSLPDGAQSPSKWLEYVYRTAHPVLRWLPTKLAEWMGENLQDELGFPDKADQWAAPGSGWTPAELNHILQAHVVDGALSTFGCVEWESELCRGVMSARCYPFDMPKHCFHGRNQKVMYTYCTNMYKLSYTSTCMFIMYIQAIYNFHLCTYLMISSMIPALLYAEQHPCYPSLSLLH